MSYLDVMLNRVKPILGGMESSRETIGYGDGPGRFAVTLAQFKDAWVTLAKDGLVVDTILMSPADWFDLRLSPGARDHIEFESQWTLISKGVVGVLWSVFIHQHADIEPGTIHVLGRKPEGKGSEEEELEPHAFVTMIRNTGEGF